jgi:hypothetical protein
MGVGVGCGGGGQGRRHTREYGDIQLTKIYR